MVLEHVERPDLLFQEMSRVMRHGAMLLSHTPNVRGYTTALTKLIPPAFRASLTMSPSAESSRGLSRGRHDRSTAHNLGY
jgi:2-polyprenyl-3-methyl-5-hydroxy-6-metoxy-1,4-benzoquinol methylase